MARLNVQPTNVFKFQLLCSTCNTWWLLRLLDPWHCPANEAHKGPFRVQNAKPNGAGVPVEAGAPRVLSGCVTSD